MTTERKIQTRTVVTLQVEVHDAQPYDDSYTTGQIYDRAVADAMRTIACLNRSELRVVGSPKVRMVITEGGNG